MDYFFFFLHCCIYFQNQKRLKVARKESEQVFLLCPPFSTVTKSAAMLIFCKNKSNGCRVHYVHLKHQRCPRARTDA